MQVLLKHLKSFRHLPLALNWMGSWRKQNKFAAKQHHPQVMITKPEEQKNLLMGQLF